jgi:hypothetical protein
LRDRIASRLLEAEVAVLFATVPTFQFYRDQYGRIIARCLHCRVGFTVREDNTGKWAMIVHLQYAHSDCRCQ